MIKFIHRQPVIRRTPQTFTDVLVSYRQGVINLTEAKVFIEKKSRKFAEPSEDELREMRKTWKRNAPEAAKGLYLGL